jgi:transposase-like protein
MFACCTCQARFGERTGTPLFDFRLPEDKAVAVLAHLQAGVGIRKTSRLTGVNKNTVVRLALQAGRPDQQAHDAFVAFPPHDP